MPDDLDLDALQATVTKWTTVPPPNDVAVLMMSKLPALIDRIRALEAENQGMRTSWQPIGTASNGDTGMVSAEEIARQIAAMPAKYQAAVFNAWGAVMIDSKQWPPPKLVEMTDEIDGKGVIFAEFIHVFS